MNSITCKLLYGKEKSWTTFTFTVLSHYAPQQQSRGCGFHRCLSVCFWFSARYLKNQCS